MRPAKAECERTMKAVIERHLDNWNADDKIMFKFTIPDEPKLIRKSV